MSAAMEASLEGINSIGFSLLDFEYDADFESSKPYVQSLIKNVLENGLKDTMLLNVNIPAIPRVEIKGIKLCRQADSRWDENFMEAEDPRGQKYYWLTGEFRNDDLGEDTDIWALQNGYISVVPSMHDLTSHKAIQNNKNLEDFIKNNKYEFQ